MSADSESAVSLRSLPLSPVDVSVKNLKITFVIYLFALVQCNKVCNRNILSSGLRNHCNLAKFYSLKKYLQSRNLEKSQNLWNLKTHLKVS